MRAVFQKAAISRTGSEPTADLKVVATGVMKPSDSFMLIWSVGNHRPAQTDIQTDFDGKPVRITVDYAAVPDGPFYAARTVISSPKKDITIAMDTYDYTRSDVAGDE